MKGNQPDAAKAAGVSMQVIKRHETRCMRRIASHADYTRRHERVDTLSACVLVMNEAARLGKKAEKDEDIRTALLALREYARGAQLVHEIQGASSEQKSIERDARWVALRDAILAALEPYPEAYNAVMVALTRPTPG